MHRTGLIIALTIAAVAAVVFAVFPELDLKAAGIFYPVRMGEFAFAWRLSPKLILVHDIALKAGFVLLIPCVLAILAKLFLPSWRMLVSPRAAVFLIVTMLLGPGLLVNVGLKDHWGRPRPIDVMQFGGPDRFVSWWDPRGACPNNCSFVSGDVATAAWTFAPAALVPSPWQPLAFGAAFALTAFMSVVRIMAGGHFPSDTIFAAIFTYLLIWLAYALIYRWRATRLDDKVLEEGLARMSLFSLLRPRRRANSSANER
jgi:membrane-associated PAP2 superfamily phosphatase